MVTLSYDELVYLLRGRVSSLRTAKTKEDTDKILKDIYSILTEVEKLVKAMEKSG